MYVYLNIHKEDVNAIQCQFMLEEPHTSYEIGNQMYIYLGNIFSIKASMDYIKIPYLIVKYWNDFIWKNACHHHSYVAFYRDTAHCNTVK